MPKIWRITMTSMMSANESPMKRDIMRTVLGAVEMAKTCEEKQVRRTCSNALEQTLCL